MGFSLFLKIFRLEELRVCFGNSLQYQTTEGKKDVYEKWYVMFEDLKNYVMSSG